MGYFLYKLLFWNRFEVGAAPLVIGIFLLGSVQLVFMGVLGEYVGAILTQVQHRPLTVEPERVNFQFEPGLPRVIHGTPAGSMVLSGSPSEIPDKVLIS